MRSMMILGIKESELLRETQKAAVADTLANWQQPITYAFPKTITINTVFSKFSLIYAAINSNIIHRKSDLFYKLQQSAGLFF